LVNTVKCHISVSVGVFNVVAVIVFRLLERLAGVVSRPLTTEQLSVVYAVLDHIITAAQYNSSRYTGLFIYTKKNQHTVISISTSVTEAVTVTKAFVLCHY